ncbi:MAG TPA: amidase [Casimicrobiaceae bacterium]|nr:amidase [Casimicrobiaceae bacterium]
MNALPLQPLAHLSRRLESGETTSVEIVAACIANIDALDQKLHAFIEVYRDDVMRLAEAADCERAAGFVRSPLHGLPIAIKDLFHIEGRQTTAGSKQWLGRIATETALCVKRLLDAGMIPLGKTHLVEFAYGTWGTNKPMGTPWNPRDMNVHRVAGGSSSGSAVAVAAGMAPAALGTDTGGSVRIPAALCGLVGFKPTYGRIALEGVVPLSPTLDSAGPITRTVDDAAMLVAAMAGERIVELRALPSLEGVHISAMSHDQFPAFIEPAIVAAFDQTLAQLRDLGARIEIVDIPFDFPALGTKNGRIIGIEGYAQHRAIIDDERADVDPAVRARMLIGKSASATEYLDALAERRLAILRFAEWMRERDALVTPMLPITAKPVSEVDETSYPLATWSRAVNYLAACAIAVPVASTSALPVSAQIIAAGGADATAVGIARALATFSTATSPDVRRSDQR